MEYIISSELNNKEGVSMKKYTKLLIIVFALSCGIGGYYFWCSYHPIIDIQVGESGYGKDLKFEAPYTTIVDRNGVKPAATVELNLLKFWLEHEFVFQYIKENFKASDIKLNVEVKDHQTILTYSGKATTKEGEAIDYNKEVICEFDLDANIKNKSN